MTATDAPTRDELLAAAMQWHTLGYTPLPLAADGSKRPELPWQRWCTEQPDAQMVASMFGEHIDTDGIAIVCGGPMALEMIEVESRAVDLIPELRDLMASHGMAELWGRLESGYVVRTPSGGIHWHYRVADGAAHENTKLARRPGPNGSIDVLVETRGQGGITVVPPSAGRSHPSGGAWTVLAGSPATIPAITAHERDALHAIASMLDRMPIADRDPDDRPTARPRQPGDPLRPGDDFNARATWDDILLPHGWVRGRPMGSGWTWTRPGKDYREGTSATTGQASDADRLWVFSTSTEFDTGRPYDKFAAWSLLNGYGADLSAAASALSRLGFGQQDDPLSTLGAPMPPPSAAVPPVDPMAGIGVPVPAPTAPMFDVISADAVEVTRVRYLWDRRIPLGAMTLMPGEEGIGKTTVGARLIADLTRGTLAGEHHGVPKDVLVLATEDGLADVFVPRLREAGADLSRVHIVRARMGVDGSPHDVEIPRDLDGLDDLVQARDVALVYIDSLVTTLPDALKSIAYKDVAKVLKRLSGWAEAHGLAVLAPWHLNKAAGSDTAVRIMDSRAFRTAVRSMLLVVGDPDAPEGIAQGIVALDKSNAGTLAVPALRYRIEPSRYVVAEADQTTGEVIEREASCGVVKWIGYVEGDGREIARAALAPKLEQVGTARQWLRGYLTEHGETPRQTVIADGREHGHGAGSIKRAAASLGVVSREVTGRVNDRPFREALWSLETKSDRKSVYPYPTGPTGPTWPLDESTPLSIYAGQGKWVQSVQSGMDSENGPTWQIGGPT